jgi:hypothetical protein
LLFCCCSVLFHVDCCSTVFVVGIGCGTFCCCCVVWFCFHSCLLCWLLFIVVCMRISSTTLLMP